MPAEPHRFGAEGLATFWEGAELRPVHRGQVRPPLPVLVGLAVTGPNDIDLAQRGDKPLRLEVQDIAGSKGHAQPVSGK